MANVSSSNGLEKRPKLRFPGFDEPYKQCHIGDIYAERSQRGASDMELLSVTMNDGVMPRSEIEGKDNSSEDKSNYKVVLTGDMVYNSMRMWQGANGISPCNGIVSPAYTVLMPKIPISNGYFAAFFKSPNLINEFRKNSQGMTSDTWNLKYPQIETIKVCIPALSEQNRVADMLGTLERRIAKQAHLVDCLKKYKRGAIKSIFTQRVSFHAEKNKWESHKMSELITLQSGQDFAPTDFNEQGKGIPYMTGASCIVEGQTVVSRWTTVPRCFAYHGDTLLVCKGSGSGAVAFLSQDKVHIARQFMALRPHGGMTKEFCLYLTLHLSEKMKQSATGLIEGIDRKTVLNQRVFLPPIVEQERIVKFLSAIEKALITQEGVLKSLVSIKKGLMQQLFI
ncbi:restriction endonuclease subunit S [Ruthenibacterium sp. CLA-JM-H11]|uniref:Restriction endonuclease subunit S n=1 Tax=Ruthenibacterium intestinale TaxID=3133163 RepID=A0ABV1GHN7_9FIRM